MKTEKLHRFFEGTASPSEENEIRRWLEADPLNEQCLRRERHLFDIMMLLPEDMRPELTAPARESRRRLWMREALKAAAVAALVLCAVYGWRLMQADEASQAMQTIAAPAGQRVQISLPDGSKVWLNARTQITYPLNFGQANRVMHLEGEAYFEVASDSKHPFIVATPSGQVKAVGTKFNVEYYAADNIFRTTLMSGKLLVASANKPDVERLLTPNKMLSLDTDGQFREEPVSDYTRYRWIEGLICFKDASFTEVMKEFEKYYGVSIRVRKESLGQYMFTGKFRHTDGIDYALRVLQRDVRFSYVRDDEKQIFYIE
ncbi:MAG: FecR domain-containing protein [Tannerellaceae bacterium]|nr:FecR domain-containing protein [Tannerellaceae bacterium]